jgi:ribonuclease-3
MTIEKNLGYSFFDKNLLNRALTRKAYALEQKQRNQDCEDQEVFRTLGDAVLKAVLVDLLIKSGCKTRDEITSKKKRLEREEMLAKVSQALGIGPFIKLGVGEEKQKANEEPKVLAETLEALIGAIYLDGGYSASKEVITEWFKSFFA